MKKNKATEYLRLPYSRILIPDEETGRFAASIVEFPGCFADGKTSEEAAGNLERAAEAWLTAVIERGQPVPEPNNQRTN